MVAMHTPELNSWHIKWVYTTKTDAKDKLERLKLCLVACGSE